MSSHGRGTHGSAGTDAEHEYNIGVIMPGKEWQYPPPQMYYPPEAAVFLALAYSFIKSVVRGYDTEDDTECPRAMLRKARPKTPFLKLRSHNAPCIQSGLVRLGGLHGGTWFSFPNDSAVQQARS